MAVSFHNADTDYRLREKRRIARWIASSIDNEGLTPGDISVILCSDAYLLDMNRRYLGHDYFTDVITFDYGAEGPSGLVSGDLFISVDTVFDNARSLGHAPRTEMHRVIIHGVLHLCGYSDKTPEEQTIMRSKEDFYLALL